MRGLHDPGGVASYIRRLSAAQRSAGHEVCFFDCVASPTPAPPAFVPVVIDSDAALYEKAAELQLDILNLHITVEELPPAGLPVVRTLHTHAPYCPSGTRHLKRWGKPCPRSYSLSGCLRGHFVDRCGSIRPEKLRGNFNKISIEKRVLPRIHVITVSRFQKNEMLRAGYPEDRIHVLHSPAPDITRPYRPPPAGKPHFAFLGRIVPEKGLDWLLRAVARTDADLHLDVAGEGYAMADMQRLATRLHITDRVTFHGWLNSKRTEEIIQTARAVVFPSVWHEPAGLVTLEAATQGRPVIAGRVGGIPEYATEDYALLVPPNDVEALALCMERLAEDRKLAECMGRKGRQTVQDCFAMQAFTQRLDEIYESVIGEFCRKV